MVAARSSYNGNPTKRVKIVACLIKKQLLCLMIRRKWLPILQRWSNILCRRFSCRPVHPTTASPSMEGFMMCRHRISHLLPAQHQQLNKLLNSNTTSTISYRIALWLKDRQNTWKMGRRIQMRCHWVGIGVWHQRKPKLSLKNNRYRQLSSATFWVQQ